MYHRRSHAAAELNARGSCGTFDDDGSAKTRLFRDILTLVGGIAGPHLLQSVLVFVRLFTTDDRAPKGLVLFRGRHHQSRHLLQNERGIGAGWELAEIKVHGLQMLLQLLLQLHLLVQGSLLACHLICAPWTIQTLSGIVDRAQGTEC